LVWGLIAVAGRADLLYRWRRRVPLRPLLLLAIAGTGETVPDEDIPIPTDGVTWADDIAPIVRDHCVDCHQAGGTTFPLTTWAEAESFAPLIASAVREGRMPPWAAERSETCEPPHGFERDLRLTAGEIATLEAWSDAGAPEGEPIAPLVSPWVPQTVEPEEIWSVDEAFFIDTVEDAVVCKNVGSPLEARAWLEAAELDPADLSVAHHATLLVDLEGVTDFEEWTDCPGGVGQLMPVLFWAPGTDPFFAPERSGIPVPPGAQFVVQMHYHPTSPVGVVTPPRVLLDWTDGEPDREAYLLLLGNAKDPESGLYDDEFLVPAGADAHVETMADVLPHRRDVEAKVWAVGHHMHRYGRAMTSRMISGDSEGLCLLDTPTWDFDWHRLYRYDADEAELPVVRGQDRIELSCTYGNTLDFAGARQSILEAGLTEPVDVTLGAGPTEEMCSVLLGLLVGD
jgi:hypothetical protein